MAHPQLRAVKAHQLDNRDRILRAARDLVSDGGWSAAQIANVAASAGMATGTVYRYFASKAVLYSEVLSAVSQRELDVLQEIASGGVPAIDCLRAAVATFVQRAMANPRLAYAAIAEPCDRAIDEVRLKYRAMISDVIRSIIERGQAQKVFRGDIPAAVAATVIVGGFMEGLILPLSPLGSAPPDTDEGRKEAIAQLSRHIAALACSSVLPPAR